MESNPASNAPLRENETEKNSSLDLLESLRARTPARVMTGPVGPAYSTRTQLDLRRDHAAAVDAVQSELNLNRDLGQEFVARWQLIEVQTEASNKTEYLLRPDKGRRLSESARASIAQACCPDADVQIVIGDGLSAAAVMAQVPTLLPLLMKESGKLNWRIGQPFFIRHCRVGVLNDIGELLRPAVAVLLIGERPGLATTESLSAYMAYRPKSGDTDAQRNLISNIHARGVEPSLAATRIVALADKMRRLKASGVLVKEEAVGSLVVSTRLPRVQQGDHADQDQGEAQ